MDLLTVTKLANGALVRSTRRQLERGCSAALTEFVDGNNTHDGKRFSSTVSTSTKEASLEGGHFPILRLPAQFLRQSCGQNYDKMTYQRNDVIYDVKDGRPILTSSAPLTEPKIRSVTQTRDKRDYQITWDDGHVSRFTQSWVNTQLQRLGITEPASTEDAMNFDTGDQSRPSEDISVSIPRIPWTHLTQEKVRSNSGVRMSFDFHDLVSMDKSVLNGSVQSLYQYGLLIVNSTPTNDRGAGISALASALSGPAHKLSSDTSLLKSYQEHTHRTPKLKQKNDLMSKKSPILLEQGTDGPQRTLYGSIWSTQSSKMNDNVSIADSAYTNDALPLHTDMTYHRDPPGLQLLTMATPAPVGGESIFCDGLAVAEYMRQNHFEEFHTLASTPRRYHSVDPKTGWYLEGYGPIISAKDQWNGHGAIQNGRYGPIVQIRHNDLDRLPDLPPAWIVVQGDEKVKEFYQKLEHAHNIWDGLLGQDRFRLVVKLEPGETAVVANQRCLHGRHSFTLGEQARSIMGCYVSQDDLESRFRWMLNGNCTFQ